MKGFFMNNIPSKWLLGLTLATVVGSVPVFAQDAPPPPPASGQPAPSSGGWRKFGDNAPAPNPGYSSQADASQNQAPPPPPQYQNQNDRQLQGQYPNQSNAPAAVAPPRLLVPAGTWLTVRVNQPLSSDHNQPGDAFTATLLQPVVADGWVVARRGQTVQGRVTEAQKAGRASGTSRLGVELTVLALVDGQQVPVKTQASERRGDTSVGRDVGAVGTTAGVGAAIGAAAAGGWGAGLGALAGAGAATIGVFTTRGKPTVIYPEMAITFRLEQPLTINTERSAQAFEPVSRQDYEHNMTLQQRPVQRPGYGPAYGPGYAPGYGPAYAPYPYYYGGIYPYYYPWWGGIYIGSPRFYYGRGYYGRGYYHR